MILTLIPIRAVYQTSAGMASVRDGRLCMRRPASLSTMSTSYVHIRKFSTGILKLGRGGECRRRPSAHASACWIHDHIRKVTLLQKKTKMSETARAVGRERTTIIVAYIGFRPSWSSNVELILRWDVYDQV